MMRIKSNVSSKWTDPEAAHFSRNTNIVAQRGLLVLDAKCPECAKKAQVNDEMSQVKCEHCGFRSTYEDYLEIMRNKAVNLGEEYHMHSNKQPF